MNCTDLIYWMGGDEKHSDVKRITEALKFKPTDTVLDFGCGIGRLLKEIAPLCETIFGADVSNVMLANLQTYCYDVSNTFIVPMLSESKLGLFDNQFDKIYSILVLQHMDKAKAISILGEFKRILKPGGRVFVQFPSSTNEDFYFRYMERRLLTEINPIVEFYSAPELKMIFKRVGLDIAKFHEDGRDFWITAVKK